jgi:hypothetical protein
MIKGDMLRMTPSMRTPPVGPEDWVNERGAYPSVAAFAIFDATNCADRDAVANPLAACEKVLEMLILFPFHWKRIKRISV